MLLTSTGLASRRLGPHPGSAQKLWISAGDYARPQASRM